MEPSTAASSGTCSSTSMSSTASARPAASAEVWRGTANEPHRSKALPGQANGVLSGVDAKAVVTVSQRREGGSGSATNVDHERAPGRRHQAGENAPDDLASGAEPPVGQLDPGHDFEVHGLHITLVYPLSSGRPSRTRFARTGFREVCSMEVDVRTTVTTTASLGYETDRNRVAVLLHPHRPARLDGFPAKSIRGGRSPDVLLWHNQQIGAQEEQMEGSAQDH